MKNVGRWCGVAWAGAVLAALASACIGNPETQGRNERAGEGGNGCAGTTLEATITAAGFWNRTISYDWLLQKTADATAITIEPGATGTVSFTVVATRSEGAPTDVFGVAGQICVTNGGEMFTQGLTLSPQVEVQTGAGPFQDLPGATVTIAPAVPIAPGATTCYPYEIAFDPVAGAQYRVAAHVTITNHSGSLPGCGTCEGPEPCPVGPNPKADFSLPETPSITTVDASAELADSFILPGFTCEIVSGEICGNHGAANGEVGEDCAPFSSFPVVLEGSSVVTYAVSCHNDSLACGEHATLENHASLTELDTETTHSASVEVDVFAGECPGGCTRTIGYWKTHAGNHGNNEDAVSPLLPVWLGTPGGAASIQVTTAAQAVALLSMSGDASNGIHKLYAQLLGAKLNIASGADGGPVAWVIADADAFLATTGASAWASLSRAERSRVLGWMTALDDYNNGFSGVPHCE